MAYEGKPASRAFWAPKPHLSYLRPPPLMGGVPETILLVAIHISLPVLSLQIFFLNSILCAYLTDGPNILFFVWSIDDVIFF